jgi:hypothetical protein
MAGQSIRGQAGAGVVGDAAISWRQGAPPGAQGAPGAPPQSMMGNAQAGAAGGPGAVPKSMMGQAGAGAVGDGAVSWKQGSAPQPGGPGAPAQSVMGQAGAAAGPGGPGKSMMGQAGAGAVGDGAVSWTQNQPGGPGQPAQSMRDAGAAGGPGAAAKSMMGQAGAGAVGDGAVSWTQNQPVGPGQPGQSMMGAAGGPGQPGQSIKDAGAAGGPGQAAAGEKPEAGAAGGSGAAGAPKEKKEGELVQAAPREKKPEAELVQGTPKEKKDAELVQAGPKEKKPEAELVQGAPKAKSDSDLGAAGGPGAADEDDASELWQGKSDEDKNLVDPDADRPDFGGNGGPGQAQDAKGKKEAFKRGQREKAKPVNPAYLTATVAGLAVVSIAAMLWFGRGWLESLWPGIKGFYEKTGVAEARPGDGLRWSETGKRLQRIGGVETLVVRGFVSNIDKMVKPVPALKLQLVNEREEMIQESETKPPSALLNPGETVEVELRLELPQMDKAKGYRMQWAGEDE